jgi:hypothetical protein
MRKCQGSHRAPRPDAYRAATQFAIVSSENRLRAAMNRRIGRSGSSTAISLREGVVCSPKILDASRSRQMSR